MKVRLQIQYEVEAETERGEATADENRMMQLIEGMVQTFAEGIASKAKAEGLEVRVAKD